MRRLFGRRETLVPASSPADEVAYREDRPAEDVAYREGRIDEHRHVDGVAAASADEAYRRGRRDERSRRRGSPLLTLLLLIVVVVGAVLIYFAIQNGSFSSGGAVVDQKLSNAAASVRAPIAGAADSAGTALENAGSNLKQDAGAGKN
jgi:hypothetical protein